MAVEEGKSVARLVLILSVAGRLGQESHAAGEILAGD
jgi:hypothetical protein